MNREEQKQTIKDYLKRLGAGEELESVRVDFVKKFQSVDAAEIMNAEQELIKEGTPISEVQRLCFMEKQEKSRSQMLKKQRWILSGNRDLQRRRSL